MYAAVTTIWCCAVSCCCRPSLMALCTGRLITTINPPLLPGMTVRLTRQQVPGAVSSCRPTLELQRVGMQKKTMHQERSMHHHAVRGPLCQQQEVSSLPILVQASRLRTASSPAAATSAAQGLVCQHPAATKQHGEEWQARLLALFQPTPEQRPALMQKKTMHQRRSMHHHAMRVFLC